VRSGLGRLLRCPACHQTDMELMSPEESAPGEEAAPGSGEPSLETREGRLTCLTCGAAFPVEKGIACLLFEPDAEIVSEIAAWSEKIDSRYEEAEIQRRQRELLPALHPGGAGAGCEQPQGMGVRGKDVREVRSGA
jgi:uncharacterized protein YbaR (Trm112 family)